VLPLREGAVEFRILGPLEVQDGGRRVQVGAGKQRAVLAILLLHANDVVSADRLVDELWGEATPETARKAVQVYVSRLRKALGEDRIRTSGRGYMLALSPDELDLHRFEHLVERGRDLHARGESALASAALKEALALWHGSALVDLAHEPFAQTEIARLDGLRVAAIEERMDADLALGLGAELVGELEALITQHPYRERLRGQLMLALYRAGRQADALTAYQETRRLFNDELGIEPSRPLQRLEGAILRQEQELEVLLEAVEDTPDADGREVPKPPASAGVPSGRGRGTRRRRAAVALVGLGLAGAVVALAVSRSTRANFLKRVHAHAIGVIDTERVGIEEQLTVGGLPAAIASGGGNVWVADKEGGTVSRIAVDRHSVLRATVAASADGVAYGAGSLWVTDSQDRTLVQVNPHTLGVVQRFEVGNGPRGVAVGEGAVWVANTIDGTVSRIDLARGSVAAPLPVGPDPVAVAVGAGAVWISSEGTGTVVRLDPSSGHIVQAIHVGNGPSGITAGPGGVWVANRQDGTVSRIDPTTNSVSTTIPVGREPDAVAQGANAIWVANTGDGTITRIDPRTRRPGRTLKLGSNPQGLALADDKLWATTATREGHRGGILRVESTPSACRCVDPAFWATEGNQTDVTIPPLVYDGLVAYRRVGGVAGATLVPDLAVRLPPPTDEGRTYRFQLRRRIRFSDGRPVRASDVRFSLERLISLNQPGTPYAGIVGAGNCHVRRDKPCDLSAGIEADDAAGTITIRLAAADPEFLYKLALPLASVIPTGTPLRAARSRPIPTTGEYRVASIDPAREIRLMRNEHFRVWAPDARPDGFPEEIRFYLHDSGETKLAAVEKGAADWVFLESGLSPAQKRGVLTRYAERLHSYPASLSFWWFLNTRVPPFDDVRVRQALNYATDRQRLVDLVGELGAPTCQILPPTFPAYRPYCPYTRNPNPAGTWTAPDLAKARALVAASGTAGMRVEVDATITNRLAPYFASLLRRLGYRSSLRRFSTFDAYLRYVGDSRNRAQIGQAGWQADTLAASNFLQPLFTCASYVPKSPTNLNLFEYCDPALDAKMKEAAALEASDPVRADELWAKVDRALVDRAVTVPWSNPRNRVLVSKRVGNVQSHPLWGTLLDQLWVK
jgi:peptide/nickel transport system substrate-binding protein